MTDSAVFDTVAQVSAPVRALLAAVVEAGETRDCLDAALRWDQVEAMVTAQRLGALADATQVEANVSVTRLSVAEQVQASNRYTRAGAYADVKLAQRLRHRFSVLNGALASGVVSGAQVRAIVLGFRHMPTWVSPDDLAAHQREIVGYAAANGPRELRVLAEKLVEAIDPVGAEHAEAARLERELRQALRNRFLVVQPDHHGSMLIKGSLPMVEGELFKAQLDALMPSAASFQHCEDGVPTRSARRADALVRLTAIAAASGEVPAHGGDRPQVVVTLSYETLRGELGAALLLGGGEQISAGEARRLACQADIIPAVLGGNSEVLDLGRAQRFFHGPARSALVLRDQGCAFPGCDAPPAACEGHHIDPWQAGGDTDHRNGVLVCAYHHRMIEPDPNTHPEYQWGISFDERGDPIFTPPLQVDLQRRRRRHHRYRLRERDVIHRE